MDRGLSVGRLLPWLAVFLTCVGGVRAEEEDLVSGALAGISGAKALGLVQELAADEMKGRKTAFEGGALVENWMLGKFSEFGLHPADAGGTYLEPFTYGASNNVSPIHCRVGDRELKYGEEFCDLNYSGAGKAEAEVVFCGYGICRPDLGWDDFAGVDVRGKIVMALRGAPTSRAWEFKEERQIGAKSSAAADKGAVGFLLVEGERASSGTIQDRFFRPGLPALWLSGAVADTILGSERGPLRELKAARDGGVPGKSFPTGVKVALEVNATYDPRAKGHNALGDIKGRDPDLNHEVVLVGAHMDHLGVAPDGSVFNGADDNASGLAVLVHLADVLTANRFRPKRTIVFCGFGAEEQGLVGSRALAARYPFRGQVVAVLNMDMVGQGEPRVAIAGVGAYPAMHERLTGYLPQQLLAQTTFRPRTGAHGDHWPFHERGIPSFFVSTEGSHPNYHTPADDAANVKPACLEAAARTVGTLLVRLATDPAPLAQPHGVADYLVREGPAFTGAMLHTGAGGWKAGFTFPESGLEEGASGYLVSIDSSQGPEAAWAALEAKEREEGAVRYRLVRAAGDVERAFREGRLALLPVLNCGDAVLAEPSKLQAYRKLGYRILAPFVREGGLVDLQSAKPVLEAAAKSDVLLDLRGLDPKAWGPARKLLGARPAIFEAELTFFLRDPGWAASLPDLGAETLPVLLAPGSSWPQVMAFEPKVAPPVLLYPPTPEGLAPALEAWGRGQAEGWDLPGSPQRRAARGALGGRLVEWLARAER